VRLSAIVVAFGKEEVLARCLTHLRAALDRVEGGSELVVVVNDGQAPPAPALTVAGGRELGFGGAVAAGLAASSGEWIALVNDDCMVEPEALVQLLAAGALHPSVGSVAAQVRFARTPELVNSAGIELDELGVARERLLGEPMATVEAGTVEVFGASATLCLFRRELLENLGLDASFFAYLEDADLAWRARMAGWRCLFAPRAVAFHHHSATLGHGSAEKHLLVGRNRVRMLAKNAGARQLLRALPRIVGYDLLYVGYVAATHRTLAPLSGRLSGLREWRHYRAAGRSTRRELALPRAPGIRDALRRNRVYGAFG
jgi:GT2 family glycosyltransferase